MLHWRRLVYRLRVLEQRVEVVERRGVLVLVAKQQPLLDRPELHRSLTVVRE